MLVIDGAIAAPLDHVGARNIPVSHADVSGNARGAWGEHGTRRLTKLKHLQRHMGTEERIEAKVEGVRKQQPALAAQHLGHGVCCSDAEQVHRPHSEGGDAGGVVEHQGVDGVAGLNLFMKSLLVLRILLANLLAHC